MANSAIQTLGIITTGICLAVVALWPDGSSAPDVLELPTPEGPREYSISVPQDYDGQRPMPVVVVYDVADDRAADIDFDAIVLQAALGQTEDEDVLFGNELLKYVDAGYNVDPSHVYVCGDGVAATRAARLAQHSKGTVRVLDGASRKATKVAGVI